MNPLYRLVYTSRNLLAGSDADQQSAVAELLAVSKRNNARVGVTGALLFNGSAFAQVLEGSRAAVESTFERIQRDPRHSDVAVLQCEPVANRGFPNWSMGFVGQSPRGRALWSEIARLSGFDLGRLDGETIFNTLLSIVKEEEVETAREAPASAPAMLDTQRLTSELLELRPGGRHDKQSEPSSPALRGLLEINRPLNVDGTEAGVLRRALDEERRRTSDLRRELDAAEITIATLRSERDALARDCQSLRRHRDVWAERAKVMAAALAAEPTLPECETRRTA